MKRGSFANNNDEFALSKYIKENADEIAARLHINDCTRGKRFESIIFILSYDSYIKKYKYEATIFSRRDVYESANLVDMLKKFTFSSKLDNELLRIKGIVKIRKLKGCDHIYTCPLNFATQLVSFLITTTNDKLPNFTLTQDIFTMLPDVFVYSYWHLIIPLLEMRNESFLARLKNKDSILNMLDKEADKLILSPKYHVVEALGQTYHLLFDTQNIYYIIFHRGGREKELIKYERDPLSFRGEFGSPKKTVHLRERIEEKLVKRQYVDDVNNNT